MLAVTSHITKRREFYVEQYGMLLYTASAEQLTYLTKVDCQHR